MTFPVVLLVTYTTLNLNIFCHSLSIKSYKDIIKLDSSFDSTIKSYWNDHYNRRRVNLACALKICYLAYLDGSAVDRIHVLTLEADTFKRTGSPISLDGHEAGGLVAHEDGFAILTNQKVRGPKYPITFLLRYSKDGRMIWKRALNGPTVRAYMGQTSTPDINGDLVYSEKAKLYCAYFVATAYSGEFNGHFGDSIQCVDPDGKMVDGGTPWICSHNTGIGFEAADETPFASVCAEDTGSIWLNTNSRRMEGPKISNENTAVGSSGEPMGGMSGSYSVLARFQKSPMYIFAWASRGSKNLKKDMEFMRDNPKSMKSEPRWLNRNVAVAILKTKGSLLGKEASSVPGSLDGDSQVDFLTRSDTEDHRNVRTATLTSDLAIVSWDTLKGAKCGPLPLSCTGKYSGTSYVLVNSQGKMQGKEIVEQIPVSGDMVTMADGRVCWPYSPTTWSFQGPKGAPTLVNTLSIACAENGKDLSSEKSRADDLAERSPGTTDDQLQENTTSIKKNPPPPESCAVGKNR
ncbi:hypothetical protein PPACK8108_LOCUS6306 [Phakopsora pachyrhizi]|uniref:Uncharacterized protein n=1 Tax=Phakopsora pachyrhizi TaxID=170000 RepID=A0AAV0AQN2_PHAPC|nr:hypothetical protein PPACK8108_LOCUS6306 [Phakopsora pachyrhizi]